jgi:hypothetical protein
MKIKKYLDLIGVVCISIVVTILLILVANGIASWYLQKYPDFLMSEADRVNENTRIIRENMITPEKSMEWYDLKASDDLKEMWSEFYGAGVVFESYTHYRHQAYLGKYYGTTEAGYRLSRDQGPWPPDSKNFNIFFFGGSTSFGVGPYWATIASYLQDEMNLSKSFDRHVYVYNFGRSGYTSSQEQILFHRLVSDGMRPNMVIFLDGLNDFCFYDGQPSSWQMLAGPFNQANKDYSERLAGNGIITEWRYLKNFFISMPFTRYISSLIDRTRSKDIPTYINQSNSAGTKEIPIDDKKLANVLQRYTNNMLQVKAVSESYGIIAYFVWQPIPTYKYDTSHHLFNPSRLGCHINSKYGYPMVDKSNIKKSLGNSFINASNMQENIKEPIYIDAFHYTAPMSKNIAKYISREILDQMPAKFIR